MSKWLFLDSPQWLLAKTSISPKVCQTLCLLESKVQKGFKVYRFEDFRVSQAQISSLPSLQSEELVLIKLTLLIEKYRVIYMYNLHETNCTSQFC